MVLIHFKKEFNLEKRRRYSGLEVSLATGSKRRQVLSERLSIRVPGERSDVEVRLTIRQANALKKFLNETLEG